MAESVDALVSNTSGREAVPVRSRLRVQERLCKLLIFKHYTKSSFFIPQIWSLFGHFWSILGYLWMSMLMILPRALITAYSDPPIVFESPTAL